MAPQPDLDLGGPVTSIVETSPVLESFRHLGACRGKDPSLFFPTGDQAAFQVQQAKAICNRCPVEDQCRQWALETGEDHGVWGGLTATERRSKRKQA
jgi:WhiB family transcriptional regulator, redox-sensing transcriptional regulator